MGDTENIVNGTENNGGASENGTGTADTKPTVESLMKELAAEKANSIRFKNALDKATSEAGEYRKQLKARMTADEQAQAEALEAQTKTLQELESLRKQVAVTENSKKFMALSMDEATANKAAEAMSDGDHDTLFELLGSHFEAVQKNAEQTFLAGRKEVNAGNGSTPSITKEQFEKMGYAERVELYDKDPDLYKRLNE